MFRKNLVLPAFLLLLTACGGSNEDTGDGSPDASDVVTKITAENAVEVSASAVYTALNGDEVFSANHLNGPLNLANSNSFRGIEKIGVTSAYAAPETIACPTSGSFTVSGDFELGSGPANGVELNTDFDNCTVSIPPDGNLVVDGTLNLAINSFSGDLFSGFNVTLEIVFGNYSISSPEHSLDINGSVSSQQALGNGTLSSEFTVSDLTVAINDRSQSFIDYSLTNDINILTGGYTLEVNGTLEDAELGGRISFETTTPFTGTGDSKPDAGKMTILGAENSVVTLTVLNSVDVMLEIDEDGDGVIDETIVTNWNDLDDTILE